MTRIATAHSKAWLGLSLLSGASLGVSSLAADCWWAEQESSAKSFKPAPVVHFCQSLLSVQNSILSLDSKSVGFWVQGQLGEGKAAHPALPFYPCCPLTAQGELLLPEGLERIHWIAQTGNQCRGGGLTVPWDPHFHFSFSDKFLDQTPVTDFSALTFSCPCWTSQDVQSWSHFPVDSPDLALIPIVCCASGGLD